MNINLNHTENFKSTVFYKSLIFLIIYFFMVQSYLWVIAPFNSSGYFPSNIKSLNEAGIESFTKKSKVIFTDLTNKFQDAFELFLPSKAFAGPSCGSYFPINEQFYKSKNITPRSTSIHYNSYYYPWMRSALNFNYMNPGPAKNESTYMHRGSGYFESLNQGAIY
ncbi:MAG: hypothetical protein ACMUIU_19205, partial [bacterium]